MKVAARTTAEIAAEWRSVAFSGAYWKPALNVAGAPVGAPKSGEAGGMFGESDSLPGRRVYMKPGIRDPDLHVARAAREKIASDLAHDLAIAVPPVVLARRRHATAEENVCISLVMYTSAWSWAEVVQKIDGARPVPRHPAVKQLLDNAASALPKAAAHALAFDTWVAQDDHGPHNNHNIVFGYEPNDGGRYGFVLLDFAYAFGVRGGWSTPGDPRRAEICKPAKLHPKMLQRVDRAELSRMIAEIENFSESSIGEIVRRIPVSHLPQSEMEAIVSGLRERQGLIRPALGAYLQEAT